MKQYVRIFCLIILITILSGCELFSHVAKDVQTGVTEVQNKVDETIKSTTNTIQTVQKKVEDVSTAATELKTSIDSLTKWENTNQEIKE